MVKSKSESQASDVVSLRVSMDIRNAIEKASAGKKLTITRYILQLIVSDLIKNGHIEPTMKINGKRIYYL